MYSITQNGSIKRDADGALIPADLGNKDYQAYLAWAQGNTATPYSVPLSQAITNQKTVLTAAYNTAISQPVSYTSKGGVTKTYQADPGSVSHLMQCMLGYTSSGATPVGFYWVAADNTQVPFTYADLQGLVAAMGVQGWTAFQHLQIQKAAVSSATTVTAVQAVVW